jgi:uncharacterized protein YjcR
VSHKEQPLTPWQLGLKKANQTPRCGAKTRKGTPCKAPVVKGRSRCRMHGGARGSGAPRGNKNALKHGYYTQESISKRRKANALMREIYQTMGLIKENHFDGIED